MDAMTDALRLRDISPRKYRRPVTGSHHHCHWCETRFEAGAKRFVILDGVNHSGGWGLASICFECFKCDGASEDSGLDLERTTRECQGCGEPVSIPFRRYRGAGRWFQWGVCSNACYQRAYRKRRRQQGGSTIDWKHGDHRQCCECCKQPISGKRNDARFCSGKCRQWQYRRRIDRPALRPGGRL